MGRVRACPSAPHPIPQSTPAIVMKTRAPMRSISHPANGIAQVIKVGTDGEDSDLLILCIAKRLQVNGIEEQIRDPAKTLAEIVEP